MIIYMYIKRERERERQRVHGEESRARIHAWLHKRACSVTYSMTQ